MHFDLSFIKGKKLLLLVNPFSPLEIFIINHSKYDSQSVKENHNVIPLIKMKPLVDTGVKISLGMQFIIQTHVCAKNSTNVWVLLIVGNIRSLCGKQLCHYVLYILTIFLDYGNAKTKQVKVSVYCYGARICKYKALYSFWYIQHVYTNQTMAYILCDGRTTVAVHFHIHEPHIKLLFLSIFYPFISMPIETLCQF